METMINEIAKKALAGALSLTMAVSGTGCSSSDIVSENSLSITSSVNYEDESIKKLSKENSGLTIEELSKKIEQQLKNVKTVKVTYSIDSNIKDNASGETVNEQYKVMGKTVYGSNNIKEIYNELNEDGKTSFKSYVDLDKKLAYMDIDGNGLKEIEFPKNDDNSNSSKNSDMAVETDSDYKVTVKMMLKGAKMMNLTEDENFYYLNFKGKNGDLLYMIDGLFGLSVDILALKDVDMDVSYKIRKADFMLVEVNHKTLENYDSKTYDRRGIMVLDEYNSFDVIDEVSKTKGA